MGRSPWSDEESPPNPVNFYGFMKAVCERDIIGLPGLSYGIGRMAGIYGLNYAIPHLLMKDNHLGFPITNYIIDRLLQGLIAEVWTGPKVNDVAHASLASDGAELLLRLAAHDENGVFHCWGSEAANRLALAHKIAAVFAFDSALIAPTPTDPVMLDHFRHIQIPFRTVAQGEKTYQALGRRAYNLVDGLRAFKREWEDYQSRLYRGSNEEGMERATR